MNYSTELAKKLLQINAIKLSPAQPFTWASGLKSPIYCDNRISLSYPRVRKLIKNAFLDTLKNETDIDAIVGVATAGIPHGAMVADGLDLPFAYVRNKAKAHGRQNRLEGTLDKESKSILIEDLISTGGSSITALEYLREEGYRVDKIFAIFSYGLEIATNNFKKANASYIALTNFDEMLQSAEETNYITRVEYRQLKEWQKSPRAWSDLRS